MYTILKFKTLTLNLTKSVGEKIKEEYFYATCNNIHNIIYLNKW